MIGMNKGAVLAHVVELKKVTKSFGKKVAVDNVSIVIDKGEIFGFLGPNGAGKTTTIRCLMDFIRPTSGTVKLFGSEIKGAGNKYKNRIGFLSADSVMYGNWTGQAHIDYVTRVRGVQQNAHELAQQFGLDLKAKVGNLSSGNKQKLGIILAIMHKPDLLVLDEPTRGLDPMLQQELYGLLQDFRQKGGAVIMSSHNLSEVEQVCDRIGIIKNGKMVASETIQGIRQMHSHSVKVAFSSTYDKKEFELPNVEIISAEKKKLELHVKGNLNILLQRLSRHSVRDIEITHASLEDIFMRYYE